MSTSPFAKGKSVLKSGARTGGIPFISLKDGDSITVALLTGMDEMVSAHMHEYWDIRPAIYHPCIGASECPSCQAGHEPRFKAYITVVTQDGEVKVLPMGIKVAEQLTDIEEEIGGDLTGKVLKIRRNGSGLKTRYIVSAIGKEIDVSGYEIPDFIPALGPTNRAEIVKLLRDAGAKVSDEGGEMVGEPTETAKKPAAKKPAAKKAAGTKADEKLPPWVDEEAESDDSDDAWGSV